jgi:hypothetical protein
VPLLKEEAVRVVGCDALPEVAVAVPVDGKLTLPRKVEAPCTSNVDEGALVLIPTFAVAPDPD